MLVLTESQLLTAETYAHFEIHYVCYDTSAEAFDLIEFKEDGKSKDWYLKTCSSRSGLNETFDGLIELDGVANKSCDDDDKVREKVQDRFGLLDSEFQTIFALQDGPTTRQAGNTTDAHEKRILEPIYNKSERDTTKSYVVLWHLLACFALTLAVSILVVQIKLWKRSNWLIFLVAELVFSLVFLASLSALGIGENHVWPHVLRNSLVYLDICAYFGFINTIYKLFSDNFDWLLATRKGCFTRKFITPANVNILIFGSSCFAIAVEVYYIVRSEDGSPELPLLDDQIYFIFKLAYFAYFLSNAVVFCIRTNLATFVVADEFKDNLNGFLEFTAFLVSLLTVFSNFRHFPDDSDFELGIYSPRISIGFYFCQVILFAIRYMSFYCKFDSSLLIRLAAAFQLLKPAH